MHIQSSQEALSNYIKSKEYKSALDYYKIMKNPSTLDTEIILDVMKNILFKEYPELIGKFLNNIHENRVILFYQVMIMKADHEGFVAFFQHFDFIVRIDVFAHAILGTSCLGKHDVRRSLEKPQAVAKEFEIVDNAYNTFLAKHKQYLQAAKPIIDGAIRVHALTDIVIDYLNVSTTKSLNQLNRHLRSLESHLLELGHINSSRTTSLS